MAQKTQVMLRSSLDAFVNMSAELAYQVLAADDAVDRMKHALHRQFEERVEEELDSLQSLIHLFLVSRHLERIADLATNIAEEVIYMITGEIVRHGKKEGGKTSSFKSIAVVLREKQEVDARSK
jgi:phosphate transport system protein